MMIFDESKDSWVIHCDKCNKVLEDDDTVMSEYRELIIFKTNVNNPFTYKSEHEITFHLCNDCIGAVREAIEKVVKEEE